MPADARIYDSRRLADAYADDRPPVHAPVLARVVASLPDGVVLRDALDVGCGAGASSAALARHAGSVTGVEPAPAMLQRARRRWPALRFVEGRAEHLPLPAQTFDIVTAAGSLNYSDLDLALAEIARVLRPGGILAVYDFATGRVRAGDGAGNVQAAAAFDEFVERFPWPGGYAMSLRALPLAASGLRPLGAERSTVSLAMSREAYVRYLMSETNVEAAIAGGLAEADARSACEAIVEPLFAVGPREVTFAAEFVVARKARGPS